MSSSVLDGLDLAISRKRTKPPLNLMDHLNLDSPAKISPIEPIFVGYHGTSVGDIAHLETGIEGSLTGSNFLGGYSQYRKQGFYVAEDFDVAAKFAKTRASNLNAKILQGQEVDRWINPKEIFAVVASVFIPRHLFNFGVGGYANFSDMRHRLHNRHLVLTETALPNKTKLWDQASVTQGKGSKQKTTSIPIGNRMTMVSGPIDDPTKQYQHQGVKGPETGMQHFFPAVSARWLIIGAVKRCE